MVDSVQRAYADLIKRVKDSSLLNSCAELLAWDERTYMPHNGSAHRAEQMALLARLAHEMITAPEVGQLLSQADGSGKSDQDTPQAANLREIRRSYKRLVKLPKELVEEIARVTTMAQQMWQEARAADDFAAFQPWLEKIVKLKRQEAEAVGYKESPYDALVDEYEPGATTAQITRVFADLRGELVPLIHSIIGSGKQAPREILEREYPVEQQRAFGQAVAEKIGF